MAAVFPKPGLAQIVDFTLESNPNIRPVLPVPQGKFVF
jgi:hypothetical protein